MENKAATYRLEIRRIEDSISIFIWALIANAGGV